MVPLKVHKYKNYSVLMNQAVQIHFLYDSNLFNLNNKNITFWYYQINFSSQFSYFFYLNLLMHFIFHLTL